MTFALEGERPLIARLVPDVRAIERLSELGVAPRVVAAGAVEGQPYVIQERIAGGEADPRWIRDNAIRVAACMQRYFSDRLLAAMATPLPTEDYAVDLAARIARIDDRWTHATRALIDEAPRVDSSRLTATHGDPNATNFMTTDVGLWLVDWDDLRRSDPMRDIGQVAWWYLDPGDWAAFIQACGQPADAVERVHWWAAAESLDVAIRLQPIDRSAAAAFLSDFDSAIRRAPNARRSP